MVSPCIQRRCGAAGVVAEGAGPPVGCYEGEVSFMKCQDRTHVAGGHSLRRGRPGGMAAA